MAISLLAVGSSLGLGALALAGPTAREGLVQDRAAIDPRDVEQPPAPRTVARAATGSALLTDEQAGPAFLSSVVMRFRDAAARSSCLEDQITWQVIELRTPERSQFGPRFERSPRS
jgi:hypothetical protein